MASCDKFKASWHSAWNDDNKSGDDLCQIVKICRKRWPSIIFSHVILRNQSNKNILPGCPLLPTAPSGRRGPQALSFTKFHVMWIFFMALAKHCNDVMGGISSTWSAHHQELLENLAPVLARGNVEFFYGNILYF